MNYGYACVRPDVPLEPFCMGKIFIDQGSDGIRPAFEKLMGVIQRGDQVTLPTLSCLGSSFSQICDKWDRLKNKDVRIIVQDYGNDVSEFMAYLEKIQGQICDEQMSVVYSSSKPGARPKQVPAEFETLSELYKQGRLSSRDAANRLNISHTTFLRWCRARAD